MVVALILPFLLVLTRVSAFIAFFPLFGKRQMPMMVKAGLAVALSVFWMEPARLGALTPSTPDAVTGFLLILKEFTIGVLLAIALGFLLVPVRIAGAYASKEIGLDGAAMIDPTLGEPSGVISSLLEALTIIIFFLIDGHHFIFACLNSTFQSPWDLFAFPFESMIELVNALPEIGIVIVAPVGVCMFVLLIALGFLNRAAPTLNIFTVGTSMQTGLGILCLLLFLPSILMAVEHYIVEVYLDIKLVMEYTSG